MNNVVPLTAAPVFQYDEMCRTVMECTKVDEVVGKLTAAAAVREYARRATNWKLEFQARVIMLRAERRAGELLRNMDLRTTRMSNLNKAMTPEDLAKLPSLKDFGITNSQSSAWQHLAEVDEKEFELALKATNRPTRTGILRAAIRRGEITARNVHWREDNGGHRPAVWKKVTPSAPQPPPSFVDGRVDPGNEAASLAYMLYSMEQMFLQPKRRPADVLAGMSTETQAHVRKVAHVASQWLMDLART